MKNIFLLVVFCCAAFFSLSLMNNKKQPAKETEGPDSPLQMEEWLHQKYADPATGTIPPLALWHAYEQLVAEGKIQGGKFYSQAVERSGDWQLVNDFFSSISITKLTYDPNNTQTFYFCTGEGWYNLDEAVGAGVFKSTDGGNSWSQLPATDTALFSYCQDMLVHPVTSDVYVATRVGLFRSQNGGASFKKILGYGMGASVNSFCDLEVTKNGGLFATTGVFEAGGIYYSDSGDSGTWVKQTNGFPTAGIFRVELATAPSDDSVAYAVACNTSDYGLKNFYKTTNKGNTWDTLPDPGGDKLFAKKQAWYDMILAVDPTDANTVVAGGWVFWKSNDGGHTWLQLNHNKPDSAIADYAHVDEHEIQFRNSDTVYFGSDGGVWKTGNLTSSDPDIYGRNYGYRVTQYYIGDIHPAAGNPIVIGGTQDNGSNMMVNGGVSWQKNLSWADGGFCAINYLNPNIMYTTKNSNGTYRFTNGGYEIPDTITNPYLDDDHTSFINPIALDPNDPDKLYMASIARGLWRLKNASTAVDSDWQAATKYTYNISAIGISKNVPNVVYFGKTSGGDVYRVDHADTTGANFLAFNCDQNGQLPVGTLSSPIYCSCVWVDPTDVNHIMLCYSNYSAPNIWESKNAAGTSPTFQNQDGDLPNLPVNWAMCHPTHPNVCYAATDLGVFYTDSLNGTNTHWFPCNIGLANVRVEQLVYRPSDHTILAVTHGRGLFTGTVNLNGPDYSIIWTERGPLDVGGRTRTIMIDPNDPTGQTIWAGSVAGGLWKTTAIDQLPITSTQDFAITNASLNVFPNPSTIADITIQLNSSAQTKVDVEVYDNTGKRVAVIMQDQLITEGLHTFKWHAEENSSSGVYYVVAIMGEEKLVKKLVLFW